MGSRRVKEQEPERHETFCARGFTFDVTKARKLAARYRAETRKANPKWLVCAPQLAREQVDAADLERAVIIGVLSGAEREHIVIDGHAQAARSVRDGIPVKLVELSAAETVKLLQRNSAERQRAQRAIAHVRKAENGHLWDF